LFTQTFIEALFLFDRRLLPCRQFPFPAYDIGLPLFDKIDFLFEVFFLLRQTPFLVLQLLPFLAIFLFKISPRLIELVLDLEYGFLAFGFRFALGGCYDLRGLCFGVFDLACRDPPLYEQAQTESAGKSDNQ